MDAPTTWRERMKEKQRAFAGERRARLAADTRVQQIKRELKARAKFRRQEFAAERKERRRMRARYERARRDGQLHQLMHPGDALDDPTSART